MKIQHGILIILGAIALPVLLATVPTAVLLRPWYLSRGSGLVAFVLMWLSVLLGLLQSCGMLRGLVRPADNLDLHEYTGVFALYVSLFHGLILIFDHYSRLSVGGVLIPFAANFRTGELALGTIALYLCLAPVVTTYLRQRMSPSTWRAVHLLSLVGFMAALLHGILTGTDTGLRPVFYMYLTAGASVALLAVYRSWLALRQGLAVSR